MRRQKTTLLQALVVCRLVRYENVLFCGRGFLVLCAGRRKNKINSPQTAPPFQRSTNPINPFFVIISIKFQCVVPVSYTCLQRYACKLRAAFPLPRRKLFSLQDNKNIWLGKALRCGMKFTRCFSLVLLLRPLVSIFTCGKRFPVQMVFSFILFEFALKYSLIN